MAKGRKPPPVQNSMHWSLKPGDIKGSYYRRLEDIKKGLEKIDSYNMPPGGKFLFLYYGCEKLGKGIVGISNEWAARDAYKPERSLHLDHLKPAVKRLNLGISNTTLEELFGNAKTSARHWRNEIAHNFGPSNVENVVKESATKNKKMHDFLEAYTRPVLAYLKKTTRMCPHANAVPSSAGLRGRQVRPFGGKSG
jgi:hypothetical protein